MTRPAPRALLFFLLVVGTLLLYSKAVKFDFISLDDDLYVTQNVEVLAGLTRTGFLWALTTPHASNWHPLTWLSLMLDAQVGGTGPRVFHATNVLLHAASVALLFLALARMTGLVARSAFVAALFAAHPLHVESVAWISERKDVLSGLLFMLALLAYHRFTVKPSQPRILLLTLVFGAGLTAKPMLVSLPLLLLLLDVWPLRRAALLPFSAARWLPLLREKLPLFVLAAVSCTITWIAQARGGALDAAGRIPFVVRAGNAIVSTTVYLRKMFWPADLSVFYPHRGLPTLGTIAVAAVLLVAVTVFALRSARKLPYVTVGWLWYLIALMPVVGLVQVGRQAMADRYTYLPSIGIFLLVTWGGADLAERIPGLGPRSRRIVLSVTGALVLAILTLVTSAQLATWRNSTALFTHALALDPDNYLAVSALGSELSRSGATDEALVRFRRALAIEPRFAEARANLALGLLTLGRLEEAAVECRTTLAQAPDLVGARTTLGLILLRQGRQNEAAAELERALSAAPDYAPAHAYLAGILLDRGRTDEAVQHCRAALRSDPSSSGAHHNLGVAFLREGRLDEAREEFEAAVRAEPRYAGSRLTLAAVLVRQGRKEEARAQLEELLRIDPSSEDARRWLEATRGAP